MANLRILTAGVVAAINPMIPVTVRISIGSQQNANFSRTPLYASPGAFTGSIADDLLTVSAVSAGALQAGQTIAGAGVTAGTTILAQASGTTGGIGTYTVDREQTVASEAMTTVYSLQGQVQPMSFGELRQMEGLNLGGVRNKVYLFGIVDAVVRPERKGGDLLTIASAPWAGNYLMPVVFETWPGWCSAAIQLQNP